MGSTPHPSKPTPAACDPGARDEDERIARLGEQVEMLRRRSHDSAGELQHVVLALAEIKLNLATQDKTLGRLEHAFNGNGSPGSPGLLLRMDRAERALAGYARVLWLVAGAVVSLLVKVVFGSVRSS